MWERSAATCEVRNDVEEIGCRGRGGRETVPTSSARHVIERILRMGRKMFASYSLQESEIEEYGNHGQKNRGSTRARQGPI